MLRLVFASIALAAAWSWLRAEFSRAIDSKPAARKNELLIRGAVFVLALVWFIRAAAGALGTIVTWMIVLGIVGAVVWFGREALQLLAGGGSPPSESAPPTDVAPPTDDGPPS